VGCELAGRPVAAYWSDGDLLYTGNDSVANALLHFGDQTTDAYKLIISDWATVTSGWAISDKAWDRTDWGQKIIFMGPRLMIPECMEEGMLEHPWRYGVFLGGVFLFGTHLLKILPITVKLVKEMVSGRLKWPGPNVLDRDLNVNPNSRLTGLPVKHLLPEYFFYASGLSAAFVFSLLTLLSGTSLFSGHVTINWSWGTWILTLGPFLGGGICINKLPYLAAMVNKQLSNLASTDEPRQVDGFSAETEYAIEHPLINTRLQGICNPRALELFCESTIFLQNGSYQKASVLYQEALNLDSGIHNHARIDLYALLQRASPMSCGPIFYWLGIHSEYLMDRVAAKEAYEKAICIFNQIGFKHRESRARCNLGNVKMQLMDSSAMDEFEQAIILNPRNGTAHINIGTAYYRISERGDPRFDKAMEAYADAIIADPALYGPIVISRLRTFGYTWKEDLEDITQRVEKKRQR
jgi:tetratricopeptide (TPR) repeat protein